MSGDVKIWPAEAPTTLWNYDLLRPAVDRSYALPLMGQSPDWEYFGHFAVGVAIIMLFAWRRFDKRTFDPTSDDYLVLKELSPVELRGPSKMLQAYLYYSASLVLIYSAFAFFGSIIVATLKSANIAGLQVDIDPASFADRNWPITLALALAGVTELFKPLDVWEAWLRQLSHRWVGIPIRVKARTEKLLRYLDKEIDLKRIRSSKADDDDSKLIIVPEISRLENPPEWAKLLIERRVGFKRLTQKLIQLRLMTNLVKDPGTWPDLALLEKVKPLAKRVYGDAETAMQQFEDVLTSEDSDASATSSPSTTINASDSSVMIKVAPDKLSDAARKSRQKLAVLQLAIDGIEKSRRETGALLAVYAERDDKRESLDEENPVSKAIRAAFPFTHEVNTGFWILMLLVPVFVFYLVMTDMGGHGLLGNVQRGMVTVFATAACETIRNAAIFLLPLTAALGVRSYLQDSDRWQGISLIRFDRDSLMECLLIIAVGSLVATVCLVAVATGWVALIAENPDRVTTVLFFIKIPFMLYILSYIFPSLASTVITIWAIDSLKRQNLWWKPWVFGALNAVAVIVLMMMHEALWFWPSPASIPDPVQATPPVSVLALIYSQLDFTDFFVYGLIAFLSAGLFALPGDHKKKNAEDGDRRPRGDRSKKTASGLGAGGVHAQPLAAIAIVVLASGLMLCALPDMAHAGSRHCAMKLKLLKSAVSVQTGQVMGKVCLSPLNRPDPYVPVTTRVVAIIDSIVSSMSTSSIPPPSHVIEKHDPLKSNDARTVYLGVRYDAEPFSYLAGTGKDSIRAFRGYSTDLCYQLFDSAKYTVKLIPITASQRFDRMRKTAPQDGDWARDRKIDVLCEATTLRFNRLTEHDEKIEPVDGIFSPLIFVSGVSYRLRPGVNQRSARDVYLAYVEGTTAEHVVSLACKNDMFAIRSEDDKTENNCNIADGLADPVANGYRDIEPIISKDCDVRRAVPRVVSGQYHVCGFPSHDDLIAWFCSVADKDLKAKVAYFGDRELIDAKVSSARARGQCKGIEPEKSPTAYTYEPYALLISKADPELVEFVQRRVYDFFSYRSKATSLFTTYFPKAQMSPPLAYLFLLNSVDEEQYYQVPDLENARVSDTVSRRSARQ